MASTGCSMSDVIAMTALDERGVRQLTLDRGKRANAIDAELGDALLAALKIAHGDATRVLVLRANGKNFCGGFDFSDYESASQGDLLLRFVRIEQTLQLLRTAPFITIARTHYGAFGAGADIVAACTYRVGASSSRFRFPGLRFGVALGTSRLSAVVGEQRARDVLLENRLIDAGEALASGLLTHLVPDDQLDRTIDELIQRVDELDRPSITAALANSRAPDCTGERELASLVRSAAAPGLHLRIACYRASTAAPVAGP